MSTYLYLRGVATVRPEFKEQLDKRFVWNKDADPEQQSRPEWPEIDLGPEISDLFAYKLLCGDRGFIFPGSYGSACASFDGEESDGRSEYDEHGQFHFCSGAKWRNSVFEAFVALMAFVCDEFLIEMDYTDPASSAGPTYDRTCWYSWDSKTIDVPKFREAIKVMDNDDKLGMAIRMWAHDLAKDKSDDDDNGWFMRPGPAQADPQLKHAVETVLQAPMGVRILSADYGASVASALTSHNDWSIEGMLDEDELRRRLREMGISEDFLNADDPTGFAEKLIEHIEEELFEEYVEQARHKMLMKFNRDKKRRRQRCGMRRKK